MAVGIAVSEGAIVTIGVAVGVGVGVLVGAIVEVEVGACVGNFEFAAIDVGACLITGEDSHAINTNVKTNERMRNRRILTTSFKI